jgi:hypothetical protein
MVARATIAPEECTRSKAVSVHIGDRSLSCFDEEVSKNTLLKAATDVKVARERVAEEVKQALLRNSTRPLSVGNLTSLEATYSSLWRFFQSLQGCSVLYAPPVMLQDELESREVGKLFNCSDYFLDFSAVARVRREQAVGPASPHLLAIAGSIKDNRVVNCLQTPMNGALRRLERGERTLDEELPHNPATLRSCVINAFDENRTAGNMITHGGGEGEGEGGGGGYIPRGASKVNTTFFLAGLPCETSGWVSSSSLLCAYSSVGGAGGSGRMPPTTLRIDFSTHAMPFVYLPPSDSANLPTNFAMLTRLSGSGFKHSDHTQQVRVGGGGIAGGGGGGGGTPAEATMWISDSMLMAKCARKVAATHGLLVTAGEQGASVTESVSYDRAVVIRVVAFEEAATGSLLVTALGMGFGAVNVSSYSVRVRLGNSAAEASVWVSSTTVVCASASGASATRRVLLTSGQLPATVTEAYSYERPMLDDIIPGNAAATGRMTVTFVGRNFGLVDFTVALRIGGTSCESSRWVADSAVKCKLAAGVSANRWVEVSVGRRKSAPLFSLFTYAEAFGSYQVWSNGAYQRKCDRYGNMCGWTGAVHGLVINEPGTPRAAACAGTNGHVSSSSYDMHVSSSSYDMHVSVCRYQRPVAPGAGQISCVLRRRLRPWELH